MKAVFAAIVTFWSYASLSQETLTVYFDFDRYVLTREAKMQLDSFLATYKVKQSGHLINLDGYCDSFGPDHYNKELSEKRVSTIRDYLLTNGIVANQITGTEGHGEDDPLNDNKTAGERKLNRRVAVLIMTPGQTSFPKPEDTKTLTERLTDTTARAGTSIVLKNLNFYGGTPFLLPESFPIVDELLQVMRRNPALVIQVQGHICCVPDAEDSRYGPTGTGLSEERAKTIYAELIGKGIEATRVSYKGFGHSVPLYPYPERTEEERVANRRVEVKIMSK
jgi:outer membrane protein OmpA-like peptidoglycan-associated protein